MDKQLKLHAIANHIALILISFILIAAFYEQFALHELPCPLCLLQRAGLVALGLAICLNLRFGVQIPHYGLMLLASLMGFGIATRQILLHITPGDSGYGSAVLGLHLYTWASIFFFVSLVFVSLSLLVDKAFFASNNKISVNYFSRGLIALFLVLILANMLGVFFECGIGVCPDNPIVYLFWGSAGS